MAFPRVKVLLSESIFPAWPLELKLKRVLRALYRRRPIAARGEERSCEISAQMSPERENRRVRDASSHLYPRTTILCTLH